VPRPEIVVMTPRKGIVVLIIKAAGILWPKAIKKEEGNEWEVVVLVVVLIKAVRILSVGACIE